MKQKLKFLQSKIFWQIATLLGLVTLFISPLTTAAQMLGIRHQINAPFAVSVVEAKEIYPMFTCPCCGQPLNKEKPCCDSMSEMIDFIDQKANSGAKKTGNYFSNCKRVWV